MNQHFFEVHDLIYFKGKEVDHKELKAFKEKGGNPYYPSFLVYKGEKYIFDTNQKEVGIDEALGDAAYKSGNYLILMDDPRSFTCSIYKRDIADILKEKLKEDNNEI